MSVAAFLALLAFVPPGEFILSAAARVGSRQPAARASYAIDGGHECHLARARRRSVKLSGRCPTPELLGAALSGAAKTLADRIGAATHRRGVARHKEGIAWVVGVAGEGQGGPALWIDRRSHRIVRVVYGDRELRLLDYGEVRGSGGLPAEIQWWEHGQVSTRARRLTTVAPPP